MCPLPSHPTSGTSSVPYGWQRKFLCWALRSRGFRSCLDQISKGTIGADASIVPFLYHSDNVELICLHHLYRPNNVCKA